MDPIEDEDEHAHDVEDRDNGAYVTNEEVEVDMEGMDQAEDDEMEEQD